MRVTFVVLLYCIAAALASPTSQLLDTPMGELAESDQSYSVNNYDELPYFLREFLKRRDEEPRKVINYAPRRRPSRPRPRPRYRENMKRREKESREVIKYAPRRRPSRLRPRPRPRPRYRENTDHSRSRSVSRSSGSKNALESDIKQRLFDVPLASFKNYIAHFMQEDLCPVPPGIDCHTPRDIVVCGNDDRHVIDNPNNLAPNQWICRILVEQTQGTYEGSGFKVKISPDVGRTVLFTAAHILYNEGGGYVPRVRIQCPGEPEVTVERNDDRDMWMSKEFLESQPLSTDTNFQFDYDYAYITYPGNSNTGFGFQGFIDENAIHTAGTQLHACGYPTWERQYTCILGCNPVVPKQYCDAGDLIDVTDQSILANTDYDFGETGGPLYDVTADNFVAYGIISFRDFDCPGRRFQRLTAEALYEMFNHMGGVDMEFKFWGDRNIYLHMDGDDLDGTRGKTIGGSVYAAFPDNVHDTLSIVPVKQSSSNQPDTQLVAIRSATQKNIFLSLDGTGVTRYLLRGGGTAKCRYGIDDGAMETFHKEVESDGQVAFRSTTFNNVYLRVDHWHVKAPGDKGEVNAQFGKYTLETNHPERIP